MDATLADAIDGDFLIRLFCIKCNRCRTFDPGTIAKVLGAATTIPSLAKRCKCNQCGSGQTQVQVAIQQFNLMPVERFGANDGRRNKAPPLHAGDD